ncbi:MAG: rhomboid family intramembrane serine protease [Clostridium sp.]|uniref:rhomboid family intramembrane serine protease n=1 Tax=Clostridium sp. TaxID=1506 RepID=UPI0025C0B8C9|nr:rhomboid family intramembrane serine protease [Clostridium sp.]MCE5220805.1 rhomboid family intramembrane serine protease [Clostridium sp.]
MKKFKENFYETLINRESFYMKQYYSNFHKKDKFFGIKELKDSIYCVLISDEKNEEIDYSEAIAYIKTLEKTFSLNMIILCNKEYIHTDYSSMAHKLIINKENYNIISCDEFCMPLKQIFKTVLQENEEKSIHKKDNFLKNKILTLVIILINIIIFIITQVVIYNITNYVRASSTVSEEILNVINNSVLISFGAKYNTLIEQGEVWRLLTSAFLHSNLVHIACNMYSLYIIGPQIQQIYGTKKYLIIYIISCITSSSLSYFMSPNSISVGASGGIFGLMGALLAFAIIEKHKIQKKYLSSLMQIIVINLFIGLSIKNIDNFGHIGGLIGGIFVGYIIYRKLNKRI